MSGVRVPPPLPISPRLVDAYALLNATSFEKLVFYIVEFKLQMLHCWAVNLSAGLFGSLADSICLDL